MGNIEIGGKIYIDFIIANLSLEYLVMRNLTPA